MSKNKIQISVEAMEYFKTIQRAHKKQTFHHMTFAEMVDDLIEKVKKSEEKSDDTQPVISERRKIYRSIIDKFNR